MWDSFSKYQEESLSANFWAITKFGSCRYDQAKFFSGDTLLFGSETKGLPKLVLNQFSRKNKLFIPMNKKTRSLNLSNSVAIVLYSAWAKLNFY